MIELTTLELIGICFGFWMAGVGAGAVFVRRQSIDLANVPSGN